MTEREDKGSLSQDVLSQIVDFFMENPKAGYKELSSFVKARGIDYYDMDHALTTLAGSFVNFVYGGKFMESDKGIGDIDQDQLNKGIQIEFEHTNNEFIARRIALDHLVEISDYYTRLDKMESEAKKEKNL